MNECSICLDNINKDSIFLDCNHNYHYNCINSWIVIKPICPLCRKILICKFRIYEIKYYFFKKYKILEIDDTTIKIYNINNKNKIILNPLFSNINNENNRKNLLNNNILKKKECLGELLQTLEINNLKIIKYSLKKKKFILKLKNNTIYNFFCKKDKLSILFNILKQKIEYIYRN